MEHIRQLLHKVVFNENMTWMFVLSGGGDVKAETEGGGIYSSRIPRELTTTCDRSLRVTATMTKTLLCEK